ncbi:ribonuclease Z [Aquisphaera giovannonii]|uniref:Ribonuclease Z n=1 Tax=Aquisphaera giovannonii TaxID=406548 RepID=A0A5B9VVV4_9BACT|nr:MBL fold metallo-hydrolase [Aquisphaera giovannonii]QEH31850.1 ribonuclease Z [Aquisphaera giovannonii]
MGDLRLIPLGVGEAFTAVNYTSCYLLGAGDDWLLIDCPHPVRKMLREGTTAAGCPIDLDRISAAAISHLHADHCCGLEDFGFYAKLVVGRPAKLLMHPDVSGRLWDDVLAAGMDAAGTTGAASPDAPPRGLGDFFELIGLDESRPVACGPFSIECRKTLHGVPTTAFRIAAAGRTLGYSADTAFDPKLIDWLSPCDLIIHEATSPGHGGMHTPYDKLAALPEALRARMRLTHLPDDFDAASSVIRVLRQGEEIRI